MRSPRSRSRSKEPQTGAGSEPGTVDRGAWYADPFGKAAERWWDGLKWTQKVRGAPKEGHADALPRKGQSRRLNGRAVDDHDRSAVSESDGSRACRRCRGTGIADSSD